MFKFFKKPFRWAITFTIILALSVSLILLDTFIIPRTGTAIATLSTNAAAVTTSTTNNYNGSTSATSAVTTASTAVSSEAVITASSYQDENIQITIESYYEYNTWIYVADIQVSSVEYLQAAFAQGTYGRNIKATTSSIADDNNAIFAINGDYYGFRDYGYVLRNGVLYRDTASASDSDEALVINSDGSFSIINETETDALTLLNDGAWQILSFGPALIDNGEITVNANSEVGQSMSSNPRTAIGMISPLHYVVIVSDGRTSESAGLSLLELAQEFAVQGCTVAYNLDGGGSSTMWFNGEIVNNPVGGKSSGSSERQVSDIVYIGY